MNDRIQCPVPAAMIMWFAVAALAADPYHELRIKREQVFEFTQKPHVTRNGDAITITFESKGFCDCTVAIENDQGKIVRHLASGVLGNNAPPPFEKNSKKQTLIWDGKDDLGTYVDDKDNIAVRVSLGLKPRFERTLFWSPKRRTQTTFKNFAFSLLPAAAPEGVYVYQGENAEYVYLFDHDGNYVRAVYPFPRDKLKDVKGLKWVAFPPDGEKFPAKWSMAQQTLLTASVGLVQDATWPGGQEAMLGYGTDSLTTAIAVQKGRIALAGRRLNRLATDGSTPGPGALTLNGPRTTFERPKENVYRFAQNKRDTNVLPRSIAFSPDGQWVYMTGYMAWWGKYRQRYWLHGLARVRFDGTEDAECWIGKMDEYGADNKHFCAPTSVAVDGKGRVYVADYLNDRIQVFSEQGQYLKSVPVKKPVQISLHSKTGDIYVCSWLMYVKRKIADKGALDKAARVPATLTHLGSFEAPQVKETYALPLREYKERISGDPKIRMHQGLDYRVEVDRYADPLRVWIVQFTERSRIAWAIANVQWGSGGRNYEKGRYSENIEIYELKEGKLELRRSFSDDVKKAGVPEAPPKLGRQRLYFDHENGWFYVGEAGNFKKAIEELVRVDPASGAVKLVRLPFHVEDLAFDMQGMAYLRTSNRLVRYDAREWREIPYDYGEQMDGVIYNFAGRASLRPGEGAKVVSGIDFLGTTQASSQHGGMGASPDGTVALHAAWNVQARHRKGEKTLLSRNPYSPRLFPGRRAEFQIRIFDRYGKCVSMDALPGVYYCEGVQIDKDRNLYVQSDYVRVYGGKRFINTHSCTLMKVKPDKARILATRATPVKLNPDQCPKRPKDVHAGWVQDAEWLYGGVGLAGKMRFDVIPTWDCHCEVNSRFVLDYFARSFVSESDRYRIAVLDTNGNLITRIGRYGNVEDGMPLIKAGGPPNPRSIGGDEVAIMHCLQMTTHTDRRLFLADWGNYRIVSVKLGYHAEERVALKDVPNEGT